MGGFCCSTLMKVFAILLCLLVALCVADDMQATCTVFDTTGCGSAASIDLGDWTEATVNATSSLCYTAAYTTDDSDEDYFVIAVRPGGDAANATLPTLSGSISPAASNGTAPAAKALCAQVQSAQEDDDMDYACSALANTTAAGSTGNVTLKVVNTGAAAATLEIYAGFADGDACGASLVSSGGSWWWIVIVLIIVIAAAVGGFLYMKKKKSSYQLYEDA